MIMENASTDSTYLSSNPGKGEVDSLSDNHSGFLLDSQSPNNRIELSTPYLFVDDELPDGFDKVNISIDAFLTSDGNSIVTKDNVAECIFFMNWNYWNNERLLSSVDNYGSSYFDAIVEMKEDAVPFIYRELLKGPTPLVHALDRIYKDEIKYEGYIPLNIVCSLWLDILKRKGIRL